MQPADRDRDIARPCEVIFAFQSARLLPKRFYRHKTLEDHLLFFFAFALSICGLLCHRYTVP